MHFIKKDTVSNEENKMIKLAAYGTLIDFEESSLPVLPNFFQIIDSTIFIFSMQYVSLKEGHDEDYFSLGGSGIVMYVRATGHYIILFDEQMPSAQIRWTISKLIYFIKSGQLDNRPNIFHLADRGDDQCDTFAYHFTCPDVILNECGIQDASDIIAYCEIPFYHANIKSRLLKMAASSKSLQFAEKVLKTNFSTYINQIKQSVGLFNSRTKTGENTEYIHMESE